MLQNTPDLHGRQVGWDWTQQSRSSKRTSALYIHRVTNKAERHHLGDRRGQNSQPAGTLRCCWTTLLTFSPELVLFFCSRIQTQASGCCFDFSQPVNGSSRSVCPRQLLHDCKSHTSAPWALESKNFKTTRLTQQTAKLGARAGV